MRTETAGKRIARGASSAIGWLSSIANRLKIAQKDRADAREREIQAALGPTVEERQEELVRFYGHYEDLVDTLCEAAQLGPTPKLEAEYKRERDWMRQNYSSLRRYVVAYLRFTSEDAQQSLAMQGKAADAFEALVAAPNLAEFLKGDDGNMISRINRTREALSLYGEHLRQLQSRD